MKRLELTIDGTTIEFVDPVEDGPYPWLVSVGTLLLAASAGHLEGIGVGEAANIDVSIDNEGRRAASLLGYPLRAVAVLYDDDASEFFRGVVSSVRFGRTLDLTIEA